MKLVIDTNILLSALIKDSATRRVIVESGWNFYYPEMSFHEVRKYKCLVLKKSGMAEEDYAKLLQYLLEHIILIPDETITENLEKAKDIMAHIDPDDVVFVAASLSLNNSVVWTDDSDFEKQNKVQFLKSEQIIRLFNL